MAKGRGHNRRKESRRARAAQRPHPTPAPRAPANVVAPRRGIDATRGPVSAAYRAWASEFARRQAQAVAAQFDTARGERVPADLFLLAPLATRTVEAPTGQTVSIQMGLPLVATRAGGVGVAPDRLAVAALLLPEVDAGGALGMMGLGQAPDMPQPELIFAVQLPGEGLRGVRAADAVAWYLARAVEAGDVPLDPRAMVAASGAALALLRPNAAPRDATRLDPASLEAYEGYGADADEQVVPPDITAPPARGGLAGLPRGAYLQDSGAPLAPLLADLRDYVIGLWPYEYFDIERLAGDPAVDGAGRGAALAALADLVRRLDDVLAQGAEEEEAALAAEGQPPAWIAQETAHYREARQALRSTRTAQELLPQLGRILFDLEIPPPDYRPAGWEQEGEEEDDA